MTTNALRAKIITSASLVSPGEMMNKLQGVLVLLFVLSQMLLVACGSTTVDAISTPISPTSTVVITAQPIATQEIASTSTPIPTMTPSPAPTSPAAVTPIPTIIPTATSTSTLIASNIYFENRVLTDASGKEYETGVAPYQEEENYEILMEAYSEKLSTIPELDQEKFESKEYFASPSWGLFYLNDGSVAVLTPRYPNPVLRDVTKITTVSYTPENNFTLDQAQRINSAVLRLIIVPTGHVIGVDTDNIVRVINSPDGGFVSTDPVESLLDKENALELILPYDLSEYLEGNYSVPADLITQQTFDQFAAAKERYGITGPLVSQVASFSSGGRSFVTLAKVLEVRQVKDRVGRDATEIILLFLGLINDGGNQRILPIVGSVYSDSVQIASWNNPNGPLIANGNVEPLENFAQYFRSGTILPVLEVSSTKPYVQAVAPQGYLGTWPEYQEDRAVPGSLIIEPNRYYVGD